MPNRQAVKPRHRSGTRRCVRAALALLSLVPIASVTPATPAVAQATGTCATVELAVDGVPAVANPFDPEQADVQGLFTGPDGRHLTVIGFFAADFTRALVGGHETLTPAGSGHWLLRVTPTLPGTWRWQTSVSIAGATPVLSAVQDFTCTADPTSHGFLRRSADDERYLRWDDGSPYTAIGENLGWYDQRGTYAYDAWLDQLAAHHATWIRVWMPSWAFGLEWLTRDGNGVIISSSLGNYTTRLDRAWQLDHVIDAARARGIVVMLTIQNHGAFTTGANSEWADNPYNAANGGPLASPTQVFTDPTGKALFARRLRYLVARWGSATNLIWELWNEVDLTKATIDVVRPWHAEMGQLLRDLDPYDHLITTSVDGALLAETVGPKAPSWLTLFDLPQIDLVQAHYYGQGDVAPIDLVKLIRKAAPKLASLHKPFLIGEAGVDYRGPQETIAADPTGQGIHELLWAGLFAGGCGSGMTWWWDNVVDPLDLYPTFDGLHALVAGVALDREHVRTTGATATSIGGALDAAPLLGDDTALVWVRNPANWWHAPDFTVITGARLSVTGLTPGTWHVEWVDPFTAATTSGGDVVATGPAVELTAPDFARELSVRLTLAAPTSTTTTTVVPASTPATPLAAAPTFTG